MRAANVWGRWPAANRAAMIGADEDACMTDIINLRSARKAKAREAAVAKAAQNRTVFGRTKAEKQAADATATALGRTLDGARRDRD